MNVFDLRNVSKQYGSGSRAVKALRSINLSIEKGDFVSIMGKSGSGKSTLLNILAGLLKADSGQIEFEGQDIARQDHSHLLAYRRTHIGLVMQSYALLENDTVYDNIALPLKLRKVPPHTIRARVDEVMKDFDIDKKTDTRVDKLSGGQRQRVSIARAMISNPSVILADEPTGALDRENERMVMNLLQRINASGTTVIIVTHDAEISAMCNTNIILGDGQVIAHTHGA